MLSLKPSQVKFIFLHIFLIKNKNPNIKTLICNGSYCNNEIKINNRKHMLPHKHIYIHSHTRIQNKHYKCNEIEIQTVLCTTIEIQTVLCVTIESQKILKPNFIGRIKYYYY